MQRKLKCTLNSHLTCLRDYINIHVNISQKMPTNFNTFFRLFINSRFQILAINTNVKFEKTVIGISQSFRQSLSLQFIHQTLSFQNPTAELFSIKFTGVIQDWKSSLPWLWGFYILFPSVPFPCLVQGCLFVFFDVVVFVLFCFILRSVTLFVYNKWFLVKEQQNRPLTKETKINYWILFIFLSEHHLNFFTISELQRFVNCIAAAFSL